MFTFRPPSKNGNGHKAGNGHGPASGNGNGPANGTGTSWLGAAFARNGHGHSNGNGNGHSNKIESVLGPGIFFQGTLTGAGGVRIEGTFDGSINVKGPVVIADGAKVTADVQASAVQVGGHLKGNIIAGKVEILCTGRVWGDLITTAFSTEEGAFLRGQVRMEDELPAPEQPALPAPEQVVVAAPTTEQTTA